ncbi:MAG TPA: DUF5677 domain-containing protein [Candidatus Limnocylindrales bacterium]|nr:DUF5677 domain-containing protein [Candidatus Limnocylindrales bacterium]
MHVGNQIAQFSRLVDAAAELSTSGRWAAVNAQIEHLAANPGIDNEWYVRVLASLCFQVFSEYLLLKRAYEDGREDESSLLAWRARNLLELSVWSIYCSKSRENARRLYEDAGRDTIGLFNAFTNWAAATAQAPDFLELFRNAKQDMSNRAASDGIESLDGPYKKVNEAAKECGIGDHFSVSYKVLSKFALCLATIQNAPGAVHTQEFADIRI